MPAPERFRPVYRSPVVGLENRWDLWTDGGSTAVISLRGTTTNSTSWLANFYAAMVPAKGELQLDAGEKFTYQLADHPKALKDLDVLVTRLRATPGGQEILPEGFDALWDSVTRAMGRSRKNG